MNHEYETNELRRFWQQVNQVAFAPLGDRQLGRTEWRDAMANEPDRVAERIGWMIEGNYGAGAAIFARDTLRCKRCNQEARLGQAIAALEWGCPANFAAQAWNSLTPMQKDNLTTSIQLVIDATECVV